MAIVVCVDDVLLLGSSITLIDDLKKHLYEAFTIKDLGAAKYFLGVETARTDEGIFWGQRKYVLDLLTDAGTT